MIPVLVVDDEKFVREGIVRGTDWKSVGCEVVGQAKNGEEALALARTLHPALIVTDIRMPKMDGIELVRTLREENIAVKVIFLTAYSDFSYAQQAIRLKASDYLLKPFHDGDLEHAITHLQTSIAPKAAERDAGVSVRKGDKSRYVLEAMDYISKHYNEPDISVGTVAESLNISEGYLSHTFKKETDYTLLNYLTRYRIHKAMELLKDCRVKVYEVAEQVGYRDIAYFSATFKKYAGISPSEYQLTRR